MTPVESSALVGRALGALRSVLDPELGLNVVDLGLVQRIEEHGGCLELRYKLTSPTCPVGDMIARGMREALELLDGCKGVHAELIDEPWSPQDMTPEGRNKLGV